MWFVADRIQGVSNPWAVFKRGFETRKEANKQRNFMNIKGREVIMFKAPNLEKAKLFVGNS